MNIKHGANMAFTNVLFFWIKRIVISKIRSELFDDLSGPKAQAN